MELAGEAIGLIYISSIFFPLLQGHRQRHLLIHFEKEDVMHLSQNLLAASVRLWDTYSGTWAESCGLRISRSL